MTRRRVLIGNIGMYGICICAIVAEPLTQHVSVVILCIYVFLLVLAVMNIKSGSTIHSILLTFIILYYYLYVGFVDDWFWTWHFDILEHLTSFVLLIIPSC